jgi:hypothetical protein
MISEGIHSGNYILKWKQEFGQTCLKALLIMLPISFVIGAGTQLLYGITGIHKDDATPSFQGTMLVCDTSDSMNWNDPAREVIEGIKAYIDSVDVGEYLGLITFNGEINVIRSYQKLQSEDDRDALIKIVDDIIYDGGTDIEAALLEAFSQVRSGATGAWPGLVMLFADGEATVNLQTLRLASGVDQSDINNQIPVNTIFYSGLPTGGELLYNIALVTGGNYYYLSDAVDSIVKKEAFIYSRSLFEEESPHLVRNYYGETADSPIRIIFQILFLTIWGITAGATVLLLLNNNRLIKGFLIPRIIISLLGAVVVTIMFLNGSADSEAIARAVFVLSMCVIIVPTYQWNVE